MSPVTRQVAATATRMFMQRCPRDERPHLPQTGTSRSLLNLVRTRVAVDAVEGVAEVAG